MKGIHCRKISDEGCVAILHAHAEHQMLDALVDQKPKYRVNAMFCEERLPETCHCLVHERNNVLWPVGAACQAPTVLVFTGQVNAQMGTGRPRH